ncbi:MAG: hypothetical protein RL693_485 [Verrucomicrobiota bacterium]|jgi:hypothetical protein
MSLASSSFLLPDTPPSWKLVRSFSSGGSEPVNVPSDCKDSSRPLIVGLPATACRTVGLVLPNADAAMLRAMIEAQLEKRGLAVDKSATPNYAWQVIGHSMGQTLVSVDVLVTPFPEELTVRHAANYVSALRLFSLPPGELIIIEEQGLFVLAANHQGRLWHSHILGASEMTVPDLAREIQIALFSLEATEGFGALQGLTLVGARPSSYAKDLASHTALKIQTVDHLPPNHTLDLSSLQKLLPTAVFAAQSFRLKKQKIITVSLFMLAGYAALFVIGWIYLQGQEAKKKSLQSRIEETSLPASEIRTTMQRWRTLEPAVESNRYPMVQLSHITNLMPPSGVLIKKFQAKPAEIELSGDARDAQTATQFLEDLKKHPKLNRFTWSMPVPSVKDKVASFKIQGKLEGGS